MIESFRDRGTEDIFNGHDTKVARKKIPAELHEIASSKLDMINAATKPGSLNIPPGNRLEKLKGDRSGQYSIRINDRFRICFSWSGGNAVNVEIVDYH